MSEEVELRSFYDLTYEEDREELAKLIVKGVKLDTTITMPEEFFQKVVNVFSASEVKLLILRLTLPFENCVLLKSISISFNTATSVAIGL